MERTISASSEATARFESAQRVNNAAALLAQLANTGAERIAIPGISYEEGIAAFSRLCSFHGQLMPIYGESAEARKPKVSVPDDIGNYYPSRAMQEAEAEAAQVVFVRRQLESVAVELKRRRFAAWFSRDRKS